KEAKVTTFGGVPYTYEMLKRLRFERMHLPDLKYITQAGGKLNPKLSEEFADICAKKDIKFYTMYGQTEATARISYLPSEFAKTKVGSIGIAIPGGKLWLEEDGRLIDGNDISGELVYSGDNVTLGYAESRVDLAKGDDNNGVLYTGDVATRDKDGFYYVVGRKKRFLKIFGNRVNLSEIEHLVRTMGYDSACVGIDDNLKIYVTSKEEHQRIRSEISRLTGINQAGFSVKYISIIPRNEVGKILYSELE
ncbi:MAG: AMP-binding protein, partial [Gammaproteobacteria bacterium]